MSGPQVKTHNPTPEKYFLPAVDVLESRDELVLMADMPGVSPENLEVTVEDGVLTFLGRVPPLSSETREVVQHEFLKGSYYRQFKVPRDFLSEKMEAALKGGVVTVRIPRDERSKPRKIQVRVES
jgi:HSP20 family protein